MSARVATAAPVGKPSRTTSATPPAGTVWQRARRWALPAFGIVVLGLLLSHAHKVDWAGAWQALRSYRPGVLLGALLLATASHALYGCFDLLGRGLVRHRLPAWRTWAIAVTSYAGNLNLGSLVGGMGLRARLYARAGLDEASVAQVIGFSLLTNWLGYGVLAGSLFAAGVIAPPQQAHLGAAGFRVLGGVMVLLAVLYVLACTRWHGASRQLWGKRLRLPSATVAVVQLGLSALNWAAMGAAMHLLLGGQVSYGTTLAVLMAASIVGVMVPIPAGLGVLEAVYLALLGGSVPQGRLMGAVLAYRAIYYLLPLAGGLLLYAALERYAARHPPAGDGEAPAAR